MKYSQILLPSRCDNINSCVAYQFYSGSFGLLPVGQMVLDRISNFFDRELKREGLLKVTLPIIQDSSLWKQSRRWELYKDEMLVMPDKRGRILCFSPTAEEAAVFMVRHCLKSYRQLPLVIYQIGAKYRDEERPERGLIRTREFPMLDAYSFDINRENSLQTYERIKSIFSRILSRLGIEFTINSADSGKIGGSVSEEFVAGFDNSTIEIAHIFYLGIRYSKSGDLYIQLSTGERVPVHMGCYGIGLTRLIPVVAYQNTTSSGLIWPAVITPFDVEIIQATPDEEIVNKSRNLEDFLQKRGYRVLLDDRDEKYGVKIKDAEMLGAPYFIIIGKEYHRGYIELRDRRNNQVLYVPSNDLTILLNKLSESLN